MKLGTTLVATLLCEQPAWYAATPERKAWVQTSVKPEQSLWTTSRMHVVETSANSVTVNVIGTEYTWITNQYELQNSKHKQVTNNN